MEPQELAKSDERGVMSQNTGEGVVSTTTPLTTPPTPPVLGENPKRKLPILLILGAVVGLILVLTSAWGVKYLLSRQNASKNAPIEITWWGTTLESAAVAPMLEEYEKKNNVKVVYAKQDAQDYRDRLKSSLEKDKGPDIYEIHNTWVPMFVTDLAPLPTTIIAPDVYKNTFYPVVSRDLALGSTFAGIPLNFDGLALLTNNAMFDEKQALPPKDWNELTTLSRAFVIRDENKRITRAGVALGTTENVNYWEDVLSLMLLQSKIDPNNPDTTAAIDVLNTFLNFGSEAGSWDNSLPNSLTAFSRGQVAMYIAPASEAFRVVETNPSLAFKVSPVPQLPKLNNNLRDINFASYKVESVSNKSKHQKEAWEFLNLITSASVLPVLQTNQKAAGGEVFLPSRADLAGNYANDPILGTYSQEAASAYSSYLSSNTNDGPSGGNSRFSSIYKTALEAVKKRQTPENIFKDLTYGISQILASISAAKTKK
ncbi:MAG: extracellular solute-binding protein [Candidatus Blackburnbacteria bacterium]|nr:extracellular solute-binding protein [Candidatus Blackburnbacteria bacterium]